MSVIIPPDILPESPETIELVDDQTVVFESQFSRRYTQRNSYGDPRWRLRRRYRGMRAQDRARLLAALGEARGAFNVVYVSPAQSPRGSFPVGELLSNSDFSNGTTDWNVSDGTLTAANGILRIRRTKGGSGYTQVFQARTVPAAFFPYVVRSLSSAPDWPAANWIGPAITDGWSVASDYVTERRLKTAQQVIREASSYAQYPFLALNGGAGGTPTLVGTVIDLLFTSMSRCISVDNGPNWIIHASDFSQAAWNKSDVTITTGFTGPDNSSDADKVIPNTNNTEHFVSQAFAVSAEAGADYCFTVAVKADGYNFVRLQMGHAGGGVAVGFNLSAGTVASTETTSGTGWTYRRRYISNMGDNWYQCTLIATKTDASVEVFAYIVVQNADNFSAFAGDGTSGILLYRATAARSGVPIRLSDYAGVTDTDGVPQSGGFLQVKGLPLATEGLLLPGDWVEINRQLKQVTAPLNSDQSGLGYLQFRPKLHRPVNDNDPIIVTKPMGRFLLRAGAQWDNRFGQYADMELTLDEVYE